MPTSNSNGRSSERTNVGRWQDKLVGKQALIAERVDEITKIMDEAGCTAHLTASLRAGL